MKEKQEKNNPIVKFAHFLGVRTVGKCCIWFNQPKVPNQLKAEANLKQEKKKAHM